MDKEYSCVCHVIHLSLADIHEVLFLFLNYYSFLNLIQPGYHFNGSAIY